MAKTPGQLAWERKLAGPVLMSMGVGGVSSVRAAVMPTSGLGAPETPGQGSGGSELADLLKPTATPAVHAQVLPTQGLLLPKGAFIDCTLETAISSALPGMTTCITATDTFSADGAVVLLERGTKLVGETRGQVQQGSPRLFVLWTEARTPTGVIVPLASPGTDELGRSGLTGQIERHWWQRFGAAILVSIINGVVQGATQRGSGGTLIYNPSGATDVMTEVLKGSMNIAPTIEKPSGDRIQVLVARDVDFRGVYQLNVTP
jgi:type IV secretion system protein VirB10